ncbi:hypothetical protein, partial [Actinocatenispora thailandica]|uniref:hypothetical protein n=1 Tax=Actinocatenispora thailandica TaxID=227318 RepID=UPI0031E39925
CSRSSARGFRHQPLWSVQLGCAAFDTAAGLGSERTLQAVRRFRNTLGSNSAAPVRELDERLTTAYATGL